MFSKTRVTENRPTPDAAPQTAPVAPERSPTPEAQATAAPRVRVAPSIMSADLTVTGNIKTQGDIQIEGTVEGDIRAHQLTIGETATIKGEIVGDYVIVNGRVIGRVRGLKVRLTATAREVTRKGRSGIYDVRVTRDDDGATIAEFRGHSRTIDRTFLPAAPGDAG